MIDDRLIKLIFNLLTIFIVVLIESVSTFVHLHLICTGASRGGG